MLCTVITDLKARSYAYPRILSFFLDWSLSCF